MMKFATDPWDTDKIGDQICNELFKVSPKTKTKSKKPKTKKAFRDKVKKIVTAPPLNIQQHTRLKNEANKIKIKSKNSFDTQGNTTEKNQNSSNVVIKSKELPENKYPEGKTKREKKNNKKHSKSSALTGFQKITKKVKVDKRLVRKKENHSQLATSQKKHIVKPEMREVMISREGMLKKREKENKDVQTKLGKALSKSTQLHKLITKKDDSGTSSNTKILKHERLNDLTTKIKKNKKVPTLRERMVEKLKAAKFRFINEQIYTSDSKEISKYFREDTEAFDKYHEGYRQQVHKWPMNPLDVIIKSIDKLPPSYVIADLGCGEAKLSQSVKQKVHSFDFIALTSNVTACDMAKVPLKNEEVNVVVFCLSLMGTNLRDYIFEANRILKNGGTLKIAEVESRFDSVENFIKGIECFGFKITWKDLSHNLFYFMDFKKVMNVVNKAKLPTIGLHPCLYKKR